MASIISAGTTSGTSLNLSGDTSGVLQLASNGSTTAVTIDTSQNVGVGTTTPTGKFEVRSANNTGTDSIIRATSNNGTASTWLTFNGVSVSSGNAFVFYNNTTEQMRLNSSGNLLVGNNTASPSVSGNLGFINLASTANTETQITWAKATQVEAHAGFKTSTDSNFYVNTGGTLGTFGVYLTNTGTSWTSNSDERLKENLTPIVDATNKVSQLRAVIGNYINDESKKARPFLIAQDVQAVLPEAVSVNTDELETLGVSYTDVIPLLVASIKELNEKVEAQAVRIAELEGAK
jgi:hypothetical protein